MPILNKLLRASGYSGCDDDKKRRSIQSNSIYCDVSFLTQSSPICIAAFNVIRVQPTTRGAEGQRANDNMSHGESMDVEYNCLSAKVSGKEDVGRGVARIMFGKCKFRGSVQKVTLSDSSCIE